MDDGRITFIWKVAHPAGLRSGRSCFSIGSRAEACIPEAVYGLAVVKHGLHSLDEAIELYMNALGADPMNAAGHYNLGRALVGLNQVAEAIYRYRRTLEIDPDRVGAVLDLPWTIATAPNVQLRVYGRSRASR